MAIALRITDQSALTRDRRGIVLAEQLKFTENQTERADLQRCERCLMTQFLGMGQVLTASLNAILQRNPLALAVLLRN